MVLPREVENIIRLLKENTHDAYIVGGCVRDSLLGKLPDDWDITTDATPEEIKKIFNRTIDTGIEHGTVTVLVNGKGFEVTTYRIDGSYSDHRRPDSVEYTDNLYEDLKRRDFTVNAMAYNHEKGIIDLFEGQKDLERKLIRCVGNPSERFTEDALRILRAVRFSARLGFDIDAETVNQMKNHAQDLPSVSAERIMAELNKIIESPNPEKINLIWETGMNGYICDDFRLIKSGKGLVKGYHGSWAALMRDNTPKEARKILKELKSDNDTLNTTVMLISEYQNGVPVTETDIRHVLNHIGPELFDRLMEIFESSIELHRVGFCSDDIDSIKKKKDLIISRGDAYNLKMLKISGNDLASIGISQGPQMGEILNNLLEEVIIDPEKNEYETLKEMARQNLLI